MNLLPIKPYLWLVKLGLAAFLGTFLFVKGCSYGASDAQHNYDTYKAQVEAQAERKAESDKRIIQALEDGFKEKATTYEKDLKNAQAKNAAVRSDLRDARLQLRNHWTCPVAGTPGEVDASAELRVQDAGNLVQIAAECDSQVRGLQDLLTFEREVIKKEHQNEH